jgi:predicted acyl esterase
MRPKVVRVLAAIAALATAADLLSSCSGSHPSAAHAAPAITERATFSAHGSTGEAYILGAKPGEKLLIADGSGQVAGSGAADSLGSLVVRNLKPGSGYTARSVLGKEVAGTKPFKVMAEGENPPVPFYSSQDMHSGLNYITMRDGVKLAATVRLPMGKSSLAQGPFPTVIEYSGYATAAPHSLLDALTGTNGQTLDDPLLPDQATAVGAVFAPALGFATVSLQMRGTGCSGGAFDLFGLPSIEDGYDAVEIVAHQAWVLHHKVGMVGISFSGFSQLYVAGTRPPDLEAIAPLSPTNDLYATGFPGGIYNDGFSAQWLAQRAADAKPALPGTKDGQPWARAEIAQGDRTCLANQMLHGQAMGMSELGSAGGFRDPSLYDVRSTSTWAPRIDVPVFIAGAFQDEETGGQWTSLIPLLSHDPHVWATITNGTHVDSIGPDVLERWVEFLDLFVAGRLPSQGTLLATISSEVSQQIANAPGAAVPALRFANAPTVASAIAEFEKDPRVRVLLDNGGIQSTPGAMEPEWEEDFSSWPPPEAEPTSFLLGTGGSLVPGSPNSGSNRGGSNGGGSNGGSPQGGHAASQVSFRPDPSARPATDLPANANAWAALPPYDWTPVTGDEGVGFISAPLRQDLTAIGPASLDLWLRSSAPDTDLQATISEVRPDGKELFVQTGALRAGDRHLDARASTATDPVPTYLRSDASPLPAGQFVEVRVPILPFAYSFRAGSRIRVTISAPGGDRPAWAFDSPATNGEVVDTVQIGGAQPSELVLSVIPGVVPPDPQPACPSLRGEPCRTYVASGNGG